MRTLVSIILVPAMCLVSGCSSGEPSSGEPSYPTGPTMRPGENCLSCHRPSNEGGIAPVWTAAGTVYGKHDADRDEGVSGAEVTIVDKAGKTVKLTTNEVGNFYTREPLVAPYRVSLSYQGRTATMPIEAPAGSCNFCHSYPDASGGPKGRIYVP